MKPLLVIVPKLPLLKSPLLVKVPPELTVTWETVPTNTPFGMVTVIGLGMVTGSNGVGIAPPHVLVSFQSPFLTAVSPKACTVFGLAGNNNPQTRRHNPDTERKRRFLVSDPSRTVATS